MHKNLSKLKENKKINPTLQDEIKEVLQNSEIKNKGSQDNKEAYNLGKSNLFSLNHGKKNKVKNFLEIPVELNANQLSIWKEKMNETSLNNSSNNNANNNIETDQSYQHTISSYLSKLFSK